MTRIVPETLYSRIILMLVIGVAVTHLISMTIHYLDEHSRSKESAADTAGRYVAIASRAFESVPIGMRSKLANDLTTPWLSIDFSANGDSNILDETPETADGESIRSSGAAALDLPQTPAEYLIISSSADCRDEIGCETTANDLTMNIQFSDRTSATFVARMDDPSPLLLARLGVEFVIMILGTAGLSYFAARWVAGPLRSFAGAAERLGHNIHATSLDESGPTEIRRLAAAFNEMQRRLRRFIDDRTQMLAAISHDLRTPITRLRLRAEFLEDDEQRAKMLADLNHMSRMTDSVLTFAKDESSAEKPRPIDITAVVESVCNDAMDAGLRVRFSGARSGAVYGRPLALKRAFGNLIDNAVNYGGTAEVEILSSPDNVTITVSDRGPGLADHELEEVFRPFYRADMARTPAVSGTGLGLSIARSILRGHGGDVSLTNRADGGLCAMAVMPTINL